MFNSKPNWSLLVVLAISWISIFHATAAAQTATVVLQRGEPVPGAATDSPIVYFADSAQNSIGGYAFSVRTEDGGSPSQLSINLEGFVFSRSAVTQSIDLFDYQTNSWEEVDADGRPVQGPGDHSFARRRSFKIRESGNVGDQISGQVPESCSATAVCGEFGPGCLDDL